jgi:hypothetical protein
VQFAQKGVSSVFAHGEFAGMTVDEVAALLRERKVSPNQLPVNVIVREGVAYTLNNRSLTALRLAGEEPTVLVDVTGDPVWERRLTARLNEIGDAIGPDFVPIVRGRR